MARVGRQAGLIWVRSTTSAVVSEPTLDEHIAPAPRVSVQAFCETVETAAAVQGAGEDRRLGKAHLKIQMGGIAAAIEAYNGSPTPNVIVIENENRGDAILRGLDSLAEVCDAGTRVVVIGRHNDVVLYREMMRRGISDYLLSPVGTLDVVRSICGLFSAPDAKPVGRIIAVVGAMSITSEYSTGMIRTSLTAMPRRGTVYLGKLIVLTSVTLVVSLVTSFLAFFVGQAALSGTGVAASLFRQESASLFLVRLSSQAPTEGALKATLMLLRYFDVAPDGLVITEYDGRVVRVNPAFLEMAQALAVPGFTLPPEQTLRVLSNLPYIRSANLAGIDAANQMLPGGMARSRL